ncbi:PBP1A family penicillin-binding protein [Anoxynatronum sibiricum]|uniref:Penicillin-binding protein 1A n=1 Tax=Anoxynatronum sibiricum TaxID=210623 RepID=A0ABU9VVQ1_9CLOT
MAEKAPRTEKIQKKKRKWLRTLRTIFLTGVLVMLVMLGAVTGTAVAIVRGIINDLEPLQAGNLYRLLEESSFIYYWDQGELQVLEKIETPLYREILDYDEMPPMLLNAFVAIEDERFWQHNGIDLRRILGAGWTNYRTGSRQGASTIHQQLAKNLFLTHEQTYTRKIQDAYYGMQLAEQLPKEKVLEVYLNTIYLGAGAYGVQAASQVYFSKDVLELNLAEMALLAGIPRNPARYALMKTLEESQVRPHHTVLMQEDEGYVLVYNPEAQQRQRLVLHKMRELGWISENQYQEALNQDVLALLQPSRFQQNDEISTYFGDLVRQDVLKSLESWGYSREEARHLLYQGGLHIHSTLDLQLQQILEETFDTPELFPGTLQDANGDLLLDSHGNVQPQAAMVVMDYRTGEIKALMGGRMVNGGRQILNRALVARQPGSAIKPLAVYTAAIDKGWTGASRINDAPVYLDASRPNQAWPRNWYRQGYFGWITLRDALQWSSNVATVKLLAEVGGSRAEAYEVMFEYLEKLGVTTLVSRDDPYRGADGGLYHDETYSTALGGMTLGISPLEMTAAYGTLANEGVYVEPVTFTHITDRNGNVLVERPVRRERVLTPQGAFVMTDLLVHSITYGTGARAKLDATNSLIPVAGKTGTTTENKDAWFVGYTPYYAAGLWIGNDRPEELVQGSAMAASLWQHMMIRIHENLEPKNFDQPTDIEEVTICTVSGLRANRYCSSTRKEYFILGTAPTGVCRIHAAPPPPVTPSEPTEETGETAGESGQQTAPPGPEAPASQPGPEAPSVTSPQPTPEPSPQPTPQTEAPETSGE